MNCVTKDIYLDMPEVEKVFADMQERLTKLQALQAKTLYEKIKLFLNCRWVLTWTPPWRWWRRTLTSCWNSSRIPVRRWKKATTSKKNYLCWSFVIWILQTDQGNLDFFLWHHQGTKPENKGGDHRKIKITQRVMISRTKLLCCYLLFTGSSPSHKLNLLWQCLETS